MKEIEPCSDPESEKLVAKGEESLTGLYESRFHVRTAVWLFWAVYALLCAAMAVGFQVGLRRYLEHVRLIGSAPERSVVWFWWGFTVLFVLVLALVPLGLYLSRLQHYVIHSDGVRLAVGKKTSIDLRFSNMRNVQVARWWQAVFRHFASGFSGSRGTGLLILLKEKAPYSFMFGGGTRLMWIEPDNPQAFLEELNRAWNGWRLRHGEAPTGGGTTSPPAGSSTSSNASRAV
jgi:hypothetical protein